MGSNGRGHHQWIRHQSSELCVSLLFRSMDNILKKYLLSVGCCVLLVELLYHPHFWWLVQLLIDSVSPKHLFSKKLAWKGNIKMQLLRKKKAQIGRLKVFRNSYKLARPNASANIWCEPECYIIMTGLADKWSLTISTQEQCWHTHTSCCCFFQTYWSE